MRCTTRAPVSGSVQRSTTPGHVFHHDPHAARAHRQVHRATDRRDRVGRAGIPVGEVAVGRHLVGAEHGEVDVPAAHHRERRDVVANRRAGQQPHLLLAGVDQVEVDQLVAARGHAEDAVLAVQDHFAIDRQAARDARGHADAQVHDHAVGQVVCDAACELVAIERPVAGGGCAHDPSSRGTCTTRCTNTPGVITCSGGKLPSGTMRSTCTIAVLAAMHITGPKFRPA
jgi:hypothetical protein